MMRQIHSTNLLYIMIADTSIVKPYSNIAIRQLISRNLLFSVNEHVPLFIEMRLYDSNAWRRIIKRQKIVLD